MAHAFNGRSFGQLLTDAEHLLTRARDYERRLTTLLDSLEGSGEILAAARALCVEAREHRLIVERMLARLLGDRSDADVPPGRRPRVLVVDDSYDNREVAAAVLEAAGYEAITAADAIEGVIVAHYARPAVILMDLNMPGLDGIGAARLLKSSEATQDLKLIAYTAAANAADIGVTRFFDDVLVKPVSPGAIAAAVRRLLPPAAAGGDRAPRA